VSSLLLSLSGLNAQAATISAFPGAEGHGAESIGGRGGKVIEVTNLNDSGPGSLREAVETSGPRTVVFRVAGFIDLESRIRTGSPYLTIAGQTAPGGGITIRDFGFEVSTHDVVIRYLRWRSESDQFVTIRPGRDAHGIVIDHCSASGSEKLIIDGWYTDANGVSPDIRDITVQKCLIAEADAGHPTAMLFGGYTDFTVDPPILYHLRIHHISVHRNFFAHNGHRNPLIKSQHTEVINNVVYNWADRIGGTGFSAEADFINNYWKAGPMSNPNRALVFEYLFRNPGGAPYQFPLSSDYIAGNILPSWNVTDLDQDNWFLLEENHPELGFEGDPVSEENRRFTPLQPALIPVTIEPALDVFNSVVMDAGANSRLTSDGSFVDARDEVDQRFIDDFFNGTGPTSPPEVAQIPSSIDPGQAYSDSDQDGMADEWEEIHFGGLARGSSSDSSSDFDGDGYTDLEEFLNGTSPTDAETTPQPTASPTPAPSPTPTASPTPAPSPTPSASPTPGPSPTPTLSPTPKPTPTPGEVQILIEAEDTTLIGGMTIETDTNASGGAYITNPTGTKSEARHEVSIPSTGTYYIWARVYRSDPGAVRLVIGADGFRDDLSTSFTGAYEWLRMETSEGSGSFGLDLSEGRLRIALQLGQSGVRIDALYVTDDPQFTPGEIAPMGDCAHRDGFTDFDSTHTRSGAYCHCNVRTGHCNLRSGYRNTHTADHRPRYSASGAWAASSTTAHPFSRAIALISSILHGKPA